MNILRRELCALNIIIMNTIRIRLIIQFIDSNQRCEVFKNSLQIDEKNTF